MNNEKLLCRKSNRVYVAILIALNFSDSKEASDHETDHNNYYYIIYVYVIITNNNANLNNVIVVLFVHDCTVCDHIAKHVR